MKRNVCFWLMIVMISLICLCLLAGCACEHDYDSSITKEPTYESTGERTFTCKKCGHQYIETIEKLEKHVVPTSTLDKALSESKYYNSIFSISIGKLVNSAMDGYNITYYSGEEAIAKGYLSKNKIDNSVNIDCLYYAIISGDTMINPEIPYMTEHEDRAVEVWMLFDENDRLINSGVTLCENLQTCALIIMTKNY